MERAKQDQKFLWRVEDIYKTISYLNLEEDMERKLEKIVVYSYMKRSAEGGTPECVKLADASQDISVKAGEATSFAAEEISRLENDQLRAMAKNPDFAKFKRSLDMMIKNKPHIRSDEVEKLISSMGAFTDFDNLFQSLSDIEMPIEDIVLDNGKHLVLNNSNYSKYLHSADRNVRKQAYTNLYEAYKKLNLTYSANYLNACKESNFITKTYNFKTTFERVCFYDEADSSIASVLLDAVNQALPTLQKLQKLKKKVLNLPDYSLYDIFAPLVNGESPKYYYNKASKIITSSLSVMGEDYSTLVRHALEDRWVDLYPTKNKDSSCYCISCYDVHPFILTNFNNTADSVSTLSHELGHAMQGYLAQISQPFSTHDCSSLTCEIASTVNEVLTKKYIIDNTNDKNEKIAAIDSLLGEFYGAIFKQSLYTEFELFVFGRIEAGEFVTFEDLNNKYSELLHKYFGNSVTYPDNCGIEWSRIPHFYSPYYVYKYVVGFASAIIICGNLLSGDKSFRDNYLEFLRSGSSKPPKDLLKLAGIDLLDKNTYIKALKLFDLYIDELAELLEEK